MSGRRIGSGGRYENRYDKHASHTDIHGRDDAHTLGDSRHHRISDPFAHSHVHHPNRMTPSDLLDPDKMKELDDRFRSPTDVEIEHAKKMLEDKGERKRKRFTKENK